MVVVNLLCYSETNLTMKSYQIIVLVLSLNLFTVLNAQNLVQNGSFESYSSLPIQVAEWYKCNSWNNVNLNTSPTYTVATPDYYNALSLNLLAAHLPNCDRGHVYPHTGDAIMGFITYNSSGVTPNFREYLSNQLASPMVVGQAYTVSFWLSNSDGTTTRRYGSKTDGIGVHFSTSPLTQSGNLVINVTPQLVIPGQVWNTDWTLYSFTYTPTTAWQYITIGNFTNDVSQTRSVQDATATTVNTAYYFIDDVVIEPIITACSTTASNSGDVCAGANTDLTTTPVTGGTYSWTGPNGFTSSMQNVSNVIPPTLPGSYDYTVTVMDATSTCTSTTSITVNSIPTADAGSYSPLCENDSDLQLVGSPVGGTFSGTGITGTSFSTNQGTQTITYSITDANGCTDTDQTIITVNPLPIVNAGTYNPVCMDVADITLSGSPVGGTFSGTGVTGTSFSTNQGTQTISYSFTNANGCTNSDQTTITVNPLPTVDAGTYNAVCENDSDILLVGTPASGTFSGTGVVGNNFSTNQGTQSITYSITDANGCTGTDQTTITVNPLPNVSAGGNQSICLGSTITLDGTGAMTYSWDNGAINGQTFTPGIGTTLYTLTGTDANGCVNTDAVTVTVLDVPNAIISSNINTGNAPLSVVFYNSSTNSTSYVWNFDNGELLNSTNNSNQVITFQNEGDYYVTLIASNGICQDIDTILINVLPMLQPTITFPNVFTPNSDGVNDTFYIFDENISSIEVFILNRWGELVYQMNNVNDKWNGTATNGTDLNEGVYFYKFNAIGVNGEVITGHGNITLIR